VKQDGETISTREEADMKKKVYVARPQYMVEEFLGQGLRQKFGAFTKERTRHLQTEQSIRRRLTWWFRKHGLNFTVTQVIEEFEPGTWEMEIPELDELYPFFLPVHGVSLQIRPDHYSKCK
jgi:hypothetical protein